ncbi:MAG: hypothetical protein WCA46_17090 [Actinocatenispora sp.]
MGHSAARRHRPVRILAALIIAAFAVLGSLAPGAVARGQDRAPLRISAGHDAHRPFALRRAGEAYLRLTTSAPGVNWGVSGHESAVLSAQVDGRYVTDIVIGSATPTGHEYFLGRLGRGAHRLTLRLATDRSRGGTLALVSGVRFGEVTSGSADYAVAAHAPVLYGRTLDAWGGAYQNAFTDVPLIAWHEVTPQPDGSYQLRYTIVWSNEDGGTGLAPASLMARWGRTTDIEWIYHTGVYELTVDPAGNTVPGSEYFQAPNHGEVQFAGAHEGHHPVLQTCTDNNNVCDELDPVAREHPMRFTLSTRQQLTAGTAREVMMDRNPWTYWITAQEMVREGKTEKSADPATPELSDERNYLYVVLKKTTVAEQNSTPWIGAAVGVRLVGDPTLYRSDHSQPGWSLQRDDPAATAVELPVGTTEGQIESISVLRVPGNGDNGGSITVEGIQRAMQLDDDYRPRPYLVSNYPVTGVTLTAAEPAAVVWTAPAADAG